MIRFRKSSAMRTLVCCGVLACLSLVGCNSAKPPEKAPATEAASSEKAATKAKSQSEDLLNSIMSMLKLESLGFTSQEDEVKGLLNQWQRYVQGNQIIEDEVALDGATLDSLREHLSERQIKQLRRSAFERSDIDRLRNDLLLNAVVKHGVGKGTTDLDRVVNVFNYLVRNTDLVPNHPDDLPLTPYQLYLLGKVTPVDRGWLFVELLRQLKINAVVLSAPMPKDAEEWDINQSFLIGVLLEKQVYLFDPKLGLPLTVPGTAGTAPAVATLEQARTNPEILKQYATADDKPYGITADMLKAPGVFLVGDTALWSYRFSRLQKAFTGQRAVVISEPLVDRDGQQGLVKQIANWPGQPWSASQLAIWSYPESQLSGQESLSAQHQQTLTRITDGWKMPVKAEKAKQDDKVITVRRPTNLLLFARLDHAQGELEDAVKGYTHVRVELTIRPEGDEITERLVYAYMMAAEDALYWAGVCKLDQGREKDQRIAGDILQQYLKVYPKGRWIDSCHLLLAEKEAGDGNFAKAIAELDKVSAEHPQAQGLAFLKRRWSQVTPATPPAANPAK